MPRPETTPQPLDEAPDPRRVLAARRLRLLEGDLYLVVRPRPDLEHVISEAIAGGVDIVQLWPEGLDDAQTLAVAAPLARLCHEHRVLFLITDRADLVNPIGADGVHVDFGPDAVEQARRVAGPAALVGLSTGDPERMKSAAKQGADYASIGPVHATPVKPGVPAIGYRHLHDASLNAELPWFAVGGIDSETVDRTLASGAERLVVVRAIADADDPRAAAAELKAAIADRPRRASSEERNAAIRADLRPFARGERPAAAALAAIFLTAIALTNLLMLAIGYQPRDALQTTAGTTAQVGFSVVAIIVAVFVWRLKAWALLLLQALLAITALTSFVGLVLASSVRGALLAIALMLASGWLFTKLIRVLARAQSPVVDPAAVAAASTTAPDADAPHTQRSHNP